MSLGLLLSALSGAGQGVEGSLEAQQKAQQAQDLQAQGVELQGQKAIQVAQATQANAADLADTQREQQASRIQAAAQPYLSQSIMANAMADHDFISAHNETGGMPTSLADLSDAEKAKYAPTAQQQLAAQISGAKDTGDVSPQGLLQSQLSDQANQRMVEMQEKQLQAQRDMEASREANQIQVTKMNNAAYAAHGGGRSAADDPQVTFSLALGKTAEAEATRYDMMAKQFQAEITSGNTPKMNAGQANPDYDALVKSRDAMAAQAEAARQEAHKRFEFIGHKLGLPASQVPGLSGAASPTSGGAAWVYNPKTGALEQSGGAAPSAPNDPDLGAATGNNW